VVCISECDREDSLMGKPWPTKGCCGVEQNTQNSVSPGFVSNIVNLDYTIVFVSLFFWQYQHETSVRDLHDDIYKYINYNY
jgi:hypothetical protein